LRRTVSTLRDAGVLRETEDGAWGFHHDLLRRSLLDAMIAVERRDAHRALAEALDAGSAPPSSLAPAGSATTAPLASAAEPAMHSAGAGDHRAVEHAVRAATQARAVDAHDEALAQLKRALSFEMDTEQRRSTLLSAAIECYDLGQFAENLHIAEEGIAIPGGE